MTSLNKLFVIYIFFFLIYFIFAYPLSWLLLNSPFPMCSYWLIQNNITENSNGCLNFDLKKTYPVLKIFFLWVFIFIISLKFFFTTKLYFFEKFINTNINLINKIDLKKKFFSVIIILTLFFSFLKNFLSLGNFNFLLLGFSFFNLFFVFYFLHLKKYILYIVSLIPLLVPLFIGEISYIIFLIIGLNFYHAVTYKDSFFKILKYTFFFFLFLISLITTQKYFIINYGYSSISRYDVNFSLENYILNVNLKKVSSSETLPINYLNNADHFNNLYVNFMLPSYKIPENDFLKKSSINMNYQRAFSRISEIITSTYTIYLINEKKLPYLKGKTYEKLKFIFIPRFLYPNKPKENYGNILICDYGLGNNFQNREECLKNNITSVNLNIILEAYMNYKYTGVIIIAILFSIFSRFLLLMLANKNSIIRNFGYCSFIQIIMYSSNLTGIIGGLFISLFFFVFLIPIKQFNA